jgi:hypothetical protein
VRTSLASFGFDNLHGEQAPISSSLRRRRCYQLARMEVDNGQDEDSTTNLAPELSREVAVALARRRATEQAPALLRLLQGKSRMYADRRPPTSARSTALDHLDRKARRVFERLHRRSALPVHSTSTSPGFISGAAAPLARASARRIALVEVARSAGTNLGLEDVYESDVTRVRFRMRSSLLPSL